MQMTLVYLLMTGVLPIALPRLSCPDGLSCAAPLCPNTVVQYTCNISVPLMFTRWTVPVQSCEGTNRTLLLLRQSAQSNCGSQSISCGLFQASNVPPAGDTACTSSILHVNVSQELQGSSITCNSSDFSAQDFIGSAKILVLSTPSAPHLSITAKLNELGVNCFSGDQDTHCNVTIQMNGAVKSVAGNTTFNGLTSNMMYPISARAINRCGDYSETSASHWTLPEAPPTSTIRVLQLLINESATQLNISWGHIGGNVSQYLVRSISGMNIFTSSVPVWSYCVGLSCAYHQIVQTTGSHYTITISSVNDGGVGPESDPVQGQSESSSNPSYAVAIGIGVGIPLLVIVICIPAILVFVVYFIQLRQCSASDQVSVQVYSDMPGATLLEEMDNGNTSSVKSDKGDLPLSQTTTESTIPSPSKECNRSQNHQPIQDRRKPPKGIPQYIKCSHRETVLTIQDGGLVFTTLNSIPDDTQLWYLDDQPDNSFMIVSKTKKMVLACSESEIVIKERRGDDSQKWLQDGNTILSSKHQTVMCVKDPGNVPVCVKKTSGHGINLCYFQSSLIVPMCLVNVDNGSVLEIRSDKVIDAPNMDSTNLSQHWYIYRDNKNNTFTIVSRKGQKLLQLDDNGELIVKGSGFEEGAAQWTMENGCFVVKKKRKRFNMHPMFRNCYIIRFQSYYLTCKKGKVKLQDNPNETMPFDRHLWILDMQPDGAFTMATCRNNKHVLSNIDNTLVISNFCCNDCQLWRREGNSIRSESTHDYLSVSPTSPIGGMDNDSVSGPEKYAPTICCKATGDQQQMAYEWEATKVVIQVSQILHQNTDFALSANIENSKVSMNRCNLSLNTQFWVLDYQLDGTCLIISNTCTKEMLVLSCDSNRSTPAESQLIMRQFSGDVSQLWRFDGGHIESVKFKDQVISLVPGSETSLCLSTKSATDKAQLFKLQSYTPVLIRCLMDNTVLELDDDTSVLKFSAVNESWPDSQVWYLKYSDDFSNSSFMIISKKNGKALEAVGWSEVKIKEKSPTKADQQWMKENLFIKSKHGLTMATKKRGLVLEEHEVSEKSAYFNFQHFAVNSHF